MTVESLQKELITRAKLLYELYKKKVFDFDEIQKVINDYYKNPAEVVNKYGIIEWTVNIFKSDFTTRNMEKERIAVLAQLLTGMKDASAKLEDALKKKDVDAINEAKKEIIHFQMEIDRTLWLKSLKKI